MALTLLAKRLPVTVQSIMQGISTVELTGRFQLIDGEIPVLLDVGHNPQAVQTLVDFIRDTYPEKRIHAVFAMMKDKDIPGVLEIMKPVVFRWYFAPLNDNPRCVSETAMREFFQQCKIARVDFGFSGLQEAFANARNNARKGDLILVFGSFFLVSEYLAGLT
jgi:Folylpolyglutamate synthase